MESEKQFTILALASLLLLVLRASGLHNDSKLTTSLPSPVNHEKTFVYILMVPDYDLKRLQMQTQMFRQDEDDGPNPVTFAQIASGLTKIVQGVIGGNVTNIFAGSVQFVAEPAVRQDVGSFLGTFAPELTRVIRNMYSSVKIALGFTTTPKSTPVSVSGVNYEQLKGANKTSNNNSTAPFNIIYHPNGTVSLALQEQLRNRHPSTTPSWEYTLKQIYSETTTTVEPLPFIWLRTTTPDEYYDEI